MHNLSLKKENVDAVSSEGVVICGTHDNYDI